MSFTRAVFWNIFIQSFGRFVSTLLGLVVFGLMTRTLGPTEFGFFATISAFLQFFSIIIDFGLTLTANRLLGETKDEKEASRLMSNLMTLRLLSAFVALVLAPLAAYFFLPYAPEVKNGMFVLAVSFFAIILTQTLVPVFQKNLQMKKVVISELVGRLGLLAGIFFCAWFKLGLSYFLLAIVFGSLINYFVLRLLALPLARLRPAFDFVLWRRIISLSWPIGLSIIFNLVYLKTDIIFLSLIRSPAEVGFYGAAYKAIEILTNLATMFMGLVMPVMVAAWMRGDKEKFNRLLERALEAMVLVAWPVVFLGIFLGRPLMVLVAGQDFALAGDILGVLVLAMAMVFLSTLFGHVVVVLNQQKKMILAYAVDAVLSLVGYVLFIPRFGVWGAAGVTVFSEFLIVVLTYWVVAKESGTKWFGKNLGKIFIAGLAALIMMFVTRNLPWVLNGIFGLVIYGGLLLVSQAVSKATLKEIFSLKGN